MIGRGRPATTPDIGPRPRRKEESPPEAACLRRGSLRAECQLVGTSVVVVVVVVSSGVVVSVVVSDVVVSGVVVSVVVSGVVVSIVVVVVVVLDVSTVRQVADLTSTDTDDDEFSVRPSFQTCVVESVDEVTDDFSSDDEDTVRATLSLQVRSIVPDDADVGAWQLTLRSSTRKVKLPMASPVPENCVGLGAALLDELALDDSENVDSAADAPGVSDAATFCCCSDAAEESGAPSGTPPFDSARWATSAAASVLPARACLLYTSDAADE